MTFLKKHAMLIAICLIASISVPSICMAGDRGGKNFKAIPGQDFYIIKPENK